MKRKDIEISDENMYHFFEKEAEQIFEELCPNELHGTNSFNELSSYGVDRIYKSLKVIYETDDVREEMCLIENVLNILDQHIRMEGLEHLLINNYSSIENGIFLEYSPEGQPKRIREHYKHQFRNAYLGLVLLNKFNFDDCIVKCLMDQNNEYACYILDSAGDMKKQGAEKQVKEIVYKSYFISALFHDIGYPLAYYFRTADEIHEFTPFFKIINPAVKTEFFEIRAILNNSLLFRTVAQEQIRKKYDVNDHGCLSAISFLMNFYYTGGIYKLTEKERCILETAAVAIYKHTDQCNGDYRMIFSQDPISYLLRICDDMQEWQRFLVMIGTTHNYLQCAECGKLVRPSEDNPRLYTCRCGKQFQKITKMENKKVNYIDICDGMLVNMQDNKVTVTLNYNAYSQIELLLSDYDAVSHREKGLENLQILLKFQKYLPEIELKYFLSNNPIALINNMIEESGKNKEKIRKWANTIEPDKRRKSMFEFLDVYEKELPDMYTKYGKKIEKNAVQYARKAKTFLREYLGEIRMLYDFLYM